MLEGGKRTPGLAKKQFLKGKSESTRTSGLVFPWHCALRSWHERRKTHPSDYLLPSPHNSTSPHVAKLWPDPVWMLQGWKSHAPTVHPAPQPPSPPPQEVLGGMQDPKDLCAHGQTVFSFPMA